MEKSVDEIITPCVMKTADRQFFSQFLSSEKASTGATAHIKASN